MDAARVSSDKIVLEREDLDLVALVKTVVEDHGKLLTDAGLKVELSLPAQPLYVRGDPVRISQAVGNVLGNATKFTAAGGTVTVAAHAEPDGRTATVS
jgi:signal transduction histidine kinase